MSEVIDLEIEESERTPGNRSKMNLITGVGGKAMALAVIPIVLMTGLSVFNAGKNLDLFNRTLGSVDI